MSPQNNRRSGYFSGKMTDVAFHVALVQRWLFLVKRFPMPTNILYDSGNKGDFCILTTRFSTGPEGRALDTFFWEVAFLSHGDLPNGLFYMP